MKPKDLKPGCKVKRVKLDAGKIDHFGMKVGDVATIIEIGEFGDMLLKEFKGTHFFYYFEVVRSWQDRFKQRR